MKSADFKQKKSSIQNCYRPEIDGLRAFAILVVIINHFSKEILPNGYLGVDIFFVISGFVITSSQNNRYSKNFKDFISDFFERRIKRLVPALAVFVLIMSIAICLFNPFTGVTLWTGLTSLFGLSNIYLFKGATDYFAESAPLNVFTHTWSLGVEEQFYILFPFLLWTSGFARQTKNGSRNLFVIIIVLATASLIGFIYLYSTNQPAAYFLMPSRFWEMGTGCLICIGFQKRPSIEKFFEKIPPLLVLALTIGVMYLPMSLASISTISIVGLSAILIASLKKKTAAFMILTQPKVVYIGLISYSLYLWHWGVLSISRWTIGIHWWSIPFQLGLIFVLSVSSYKWIETPLRKKSWFGKRWKTILINIGILISLSINFFLLGKPLKGKLFLGSKYVKWNLKHFGEIKITNNPKLPTIYLIGDSHAGHYGAAIINLASKQEYNFIVHPRARRLKPPNINSEEHILAPLREYKEKFKKGDVIIFSAFINKYYKEGQDFTKQYSTFIEQTQSIGMKFILISPTPTFSGLHEGLTCQEEWYRPSWAISQNCFKQFNKKEWFTKNIIPLSKIEKFLKTNPEVYYFDAFSLLCPNLYCKNYDQNEFMYRDTQHLNSYGAMKISEKIETLIKSK